MLLLLMVAANLLLANAL